MQPKLNNAVVNPKPYSPIFPVARCCLLWRA